MTPEQKRIYNKQYYRQHKDQWERYATKKSTTAATLKPGSNIGTSLSNRIESAKDFNKAAANKKAFEKARSKAYSKASRETGKAYSGKLSSTRAVNAVIGRRLNEKKSHTEKRAEMEARRSYVTGKASTHSHNKIGIVTRALDSYKSAYKTGLKDLKLKRDKAKNSLSKIYYSLFGGL